MSRFYFHIKSGETIDRDDEGQELPNVAAAKEEALASARELLSDAIKGAKDDVPNYFIVADARGQEVATVALRDALPKSWQ